MRHGFKIFDSDTHLNPMAETLEPYFDAAMRKMVTDFLGDNVLMYSSDYPHAESRFPESTNKVLAWKSLGDDIMRKMLWANATRCFGEP